MYKSVLVPVDPVAPEDARLALARARHFVSDEGALLRLIAVAAHVQGFIAGHLPSDWANRALVDMRERLEEISAALALPPGTTSVSVRHGTVYREVLEEAEAFNADLIVLAARDATNPYQLGSNASAVARLADCSVLIVRE